MIMEIMILRYVAIVQTITMIIMINLQMGSTQMGTQQMTSPTNENDDNLIII